ncbi:MAG: O-antigen ligase family protein [Candidatus Paceibacterota bacterium]
MKLIEFTLFYFYLKSYAVYKFGFSNILMVIIFGGLFQAVVAVSQFLTQSDIGLRFLGESILGKDMAGIASFYNLHGEKVIRAYGTTPHPNIAAAYLFLAIFACYARLPAGRQVWFYKKVRYEYLFWTGYALLLFGLFFTFARVAVFLLGANFVIRGSLLWFRFKKVFWRGKPLKVVWVTGLVILAFAVLYWPEALSRVRISGDEEAVQLRIFYGKETLKAGINWLGVGSGNFLNWLMAEDPNLPRHLYQPVHNIYLLIYSETGILGLFSFFLFLVFLVREFIQRTKLERFHHYSVLLVFSSFLFMGLFDHFLWTLQQGRFLFWLVLAMVAVDPVVNFPKGPTKSDLKPEAIGKSITGLKKTTT